MEVSNSNLSAIYKVLENAINSSNEMAEKMIKVQQSQNIEAQSRAITNSIIDLYV